ncbi:MAG: cyclic nucleotide-binding domain-containing protein [Chloroflexi bacterium]|nr:cyclic nucleotide-binding domain-containing protein [Chloroflexota bacterium]
MTLPSTEPQRSAQAAADEEFLTGVPLFAGLTPKQIAAVRSICRPVIMPAGLQIVREGETGDVMYILTEGQVEISRVLTLRTATGGMAASEKSFTRLDARDRVFLGEMALLDRGERAATVAALTDCRLLEIGHDPFETLCEMDPSLGQVVFRNMARELSARLRRTSHDVLKLTTALSLALGDR